MKQLGLIVISLAVALAAACESDPAAPDGGDGQVDAAVDPPTASPAAAVLAAGGTVQSPTFTLDVQIGEALVPRPVTAGDTTLAPHGPIQP